MNRRLSQADVYNLDDSEYRAYVRSELARARTKATPRTRGVIDVLLTMLFFLGIILVVLHQNGLIGK